MIVSLILRDERGKKSWSKMEQNSFLHLLFSLTFFLQSPLLLLANQSAMLNGMLCVSKRTDVLVNLSGALFGRMRHREKLSHQKIMRLNYAPNLSRNRTSTYIICPVSKKMILFLGHVLKVGRARFRALIFMQIVLTMLHY